MKNLGRAIKAKFPDKNGDGTDYLVVDHLDGIGERVTVWNLPGNPPQNQQQVDAWLQSNAEGLVEGDAHREPDWPTLEERVAALEDGDMSMKGRMNAIKQRVRGRGPR